MLDEILQRSRNSPNAPGAVNPPALEISSLRSAAGKTSLLYHVAARAVLPAVITTKSLSSTHSTGDGDTEDAEGALGVNTELEDNEVELEPGLGHHASGHILDHCSLNRRNPMYIARPNPDIDSVLELTLRNRDNARCRDINISGPDLNPCLHAPFKSEANPYSGPGMGGAIVVVDADGRFNVSRLYIVAASMLSDWWDQTRPREKGIQFQTQRLNAQIQANFRTDNARHQADSFSGEKKSEGWSGGDSRESRDGKESRSADGAEMDMEAVQEAESNGNVDTCIGFGADTEANVSSISVHGDTAEINMNANIPPNTNTGVKPEATRVGTSTSAISNHVVDAIVRSSLDHVIIVRPRNSSELLQTLQELETYLLDGASGSDFLKHVSLQNEREYNQHRKRGHRREQIPQHYQQHIKHKSGARRLRAILLDSASAFYWQDRREMDVAHVSGMAMVPGTVFNMGSATVAGSGSETKLGAAPGSTKMGPDTDEGTTRTASTEPTPTLDPRTLAATIVSQLRHLQNLFTCPLLYTSWTVSVPRRLPNFTPNGLFNHIGPPEPETRLCLLPPWFSLPVARLIVGRANVKPFPHGRDLGGDGEWLGPGPAILVNEAEARARQREVRRGRCWAVVEGVWGTDWKAGSGLVPLAGTGHRSGAGFWFAVTCRGVEVGDALTIG